MTSQHCKRHRIAVVQLILIMTLFVISFMGVAMLANNVAASRLVGYIYFINHVGNFFIYLAVNSEFRKQVKQLFEKMKVIWRKRKASTIS